MSRDPFPLATGLAARVVDQIPAIVAGEPCELMRPHPCSHHRGDPLYTEAPPFGFCSQHDTTGDAGAHDAP